MSMRLTVSDLQSPQARISAALNVCPDSDRFFGWLNQAEELLLNQGRWWGSVVEAQFCVRDFCLTFPRSVAVVEQVKVCEQNIDIENGWFGFTRLLPGMPACEGCRTGHTQSGCRGFGQCSCGHVQMRMKEGTAASFATTRGANKVIRSYPTNSSDIGKKIIYQGRDKNGIWVRTIINGTMQDGEQVSLNMPFVDTVTVWGDGSPQAVKKDATVQRVLVYSYDTSTHLEKALAIYEPSETHPSYRVAHIPGMRATGCQRGCTTGDDTDDFRTTVTALVSLQHIDVSTPNDWLVLQNRSAYKAAMMAVKAWETGDAAMGDFYFYGTQAGGRNARGVTRVVNRGGAIPLLQAELRKMSGDRTSAYIYVDETETFARTMMGFR